MASRDDDLEKRWQTDPRWANVKRTYRASEVASLRPALAIEHSLARFTSEKLWSMLQSRPFVRALGALTGAQGVQMVGAGLEAIYLSGWQVAADNNLAGHTYPDQSLYPSNSVPTLVRRINNALTRADQVTRVSDGGSAKSGGERCRGLGWYAPIIADAEAGFGGPLHAFELMKSMIEAGAAGVHFEDQLAAEKKCGHLGGKVLIPTSQFVRTLTAARLASDVLDVPTVLVARTDALNATLLTSDIDPGDQKFLTGRRTPEGFHVIRDGLEPTIARGLAYAPYADLLWFETSRPDLGEAREFAAEIRRAYPGKIFAYNCSPSFNWKKNLDDATISKFQESLAELGYRFQFITLAGWHVLNMQTFALARGYRDTGMTAYVKLQEQEFASETSGYTAVRHQQESGTGYFDKVLMTIAGGETSTSALKGSTESAQFDH
jgi:isocitrate lyase